MRKINIALLFLVSNTIFFIILATLLPLQYETTDDVFMCLLANGKITGSPEFHLVYINSIFGLFLSLLYNTFSGVEWYTITFCVLHVISMAYISYCLYFSKRKTLLKVTLLLLFYVLWARIIISFQFTTTAGLLAFAGCLALTRETNKHFIIGAIYLLIASMIRFQAAGLVGIMMLPLFIQKITNKLFLFKMAGLLSLICGCYLLNIVTYSNDNWKYYYEYNKARGRCNDNPNAYLAFDCLPKGISQNDFQHLLNFNPDPNVIDLHSIKEIEEIIKNKAEERGLRCLKNLSVFPGMKFPPYVPLIMLTLLYVISIVYAPSKRDRAYLLWTIFAFFAVITFLGCFFIIKDRVLLCMIMPAFYIAASITNERINAISIVLISTMLLFAKQTLDQCKDNHEWNSDLQTYFWPLLNNNSDRLIWPCYGIDSFNPFCYFDMPYEIIDGSSMRYPSNKNYLKSYIDILQKKPLFIEKNNSKNGSSTSAITDIIQGIQEHYGMEARPRVVQQNKKYKAVEIILCDKITQ